MDSHRARGGRSSTISRMDLRLTLVVDRALDLAVQAPDGARWGDLLTELRSVGLVTDDAPPTWYAGAVPVSADACLGNGLLLDGAVISRRPAGTASTAQTLSAATTSDGVGHLLVNRRPRHLPRADPVVIRLPSAPDEPHRPRLPVLAIAAPLVLAVPMAWLQHSPVYLLFGLTSPAMLLGSLVSDRRGRRADHRRALAAWREERGRREAQADQAVATERKDQQQALPDHDELLDTVQHRRGRLWERRIGDPDAFTVRIGTGRRPASVRVVDEGSTASAEHAVLDDVPIGVRLAEVGALGLAGPPDEVRGLGRAVLAQVAGWHSPREVRLCLLAADRAALEQWRWASLLPHCRPDPGTGPPSSTGSLDRPDQVRQRVAELLDLLADRRRSSATGPGRPGGPPDWPGPAVVLLLDGARRLRSVPGVSRLLDEGPAVGILSLCLDSTRAALPVECQAFLELAPAAGGPGRAGTLTAPGQPPQPIAADWVGPDWADTFARSVAPLRDATPADALSQLPDSCRLLDLLPDKAIQPDRLAADWCAGRSSTVAVIGLNADGPHAVDLRHDGPHALVAGTTGAGKSELLQTLIASLALANSPADLSFVLVDYKGGSAFDQCARLPHTVGLVTDLDPHLAQRALTSLSAELKRREVLLRAAGARDIDDYVRRRSRPSDGRESADRPRLARLVLVIDEFRMIAEELPTFLDGMVRIAALGRSLGVHLVLATQRPAGIVSADIAANVNLRIALRVRDQVDSDDVIEARDAAAISVHRPGRAYARAGSNPLVMFQTARVAGSGGRPSRRRCTVRRLSIDDLGDQPPIVVASESDEGATDLARIVAATRAAADRLGRPPAPPPWLPPLPDHLTLTDLDPGRLPWTAAYAAVDRPEQQTQQTLAWDLAGDSHLAVVGTMRTGRTTLLRTLAGAIGQRFSPDDVHLHVVDGGGGGLLSIARLPHAGVVTTVDQPARSIRLLDRLAEEVRRRRDVLATGGFGSVTEHRAVAAPDQRMPFVVLLVDGWEGVSSAWEGIEHGRPVERLHQLMRDGPGVGLLVALAGDRGLLLSRTAALVRDKIVLRLADPTDLAMAGIPVASIPSRLPPGRGVRVTDHTEVQVALLDPDPSGPAQIAALDRIAQRSHPPRTGAGPVRVVPLPARVALGDLMAAGAPTAPGWALVGAGGDTAEPVGLALLGSSALVAGPPRSGRSTVLATMATWLGRHGREVLAVTSGPSPLTELAGRPGGVEVVDAAAAQQLSDLLTCRPDACVVVDDVERLLDTAAEDVVHQWFTSAAGRAGSLVVAGTTADLTGTFRGLSVLARRSGHGVLLHPSTYADGDLLGIRLAGPESPDRLPGRGLLVRDGAAVPVQVAWPGPSEPVNPGSGSR